MDLIVDRVIERISEGNYEPKRYRIIRLKTISGNIHAVIVDIKDEQSEMLVALSVLEDKNKYRIMNKNRFTILHRRNKLLEVGHHYLSDL